ncbi:5-dehydro-4-deoxy-D-glucuronate isomerase [Paraglaciecola sp. L3A3]|uniref:5-dehydro-4-deoxy-D-glucuronate isomerase n=1 Tax=Paraglaciecola sp. L3A3 TaxID=2686358 RepID=UPI00131ECAE8|nr:5-dehydro-4-deoxy-D-glucuronate isomerase [Paraglaciecola sp. L3A3]
MTIQFETRYAVGPNEAKNFTTEQLREAFVGDNLFEDNKINLIYTHYDRYIVGAAVPTKEPLVLDSIDPLKSEHFLSRRELGAVNIGQAGVVIVDGEEFSIGNKEAIYVGSGTKEVIFKSVNPEAPARFYINSAQAFKSFPTKKITMADATVLHMGSQETSNERTIAQLIVQGVVDTCQLQMGLTSLKTGSVWNTMPAHQHDRRMEAYLYFDIKEDQAVAHFMGEPKQTRVIWAGNEQVMISPAWSIHCGSGTSNYSFIWGMAGENLDYNDMDKYQASELR